MTTPATTTTTTTVTMTVSIIAMSLYPDFPKRGLLSSRTPHSGIAQTIRPPVEVVNRRLNRFKLASKNRSVAPAGWTTRSPKSSGSSRPIAGSRMAIFSPDSPGRSLSGNRHCRERRDDRDSRDRWVGKRECAFPCIRVRGRAGWVQSPRCGAARRHALTQPVSSVDNARQRHRIPG